MKITHLDQVTGWRQTIDQSINTWTNWLLALFFLFSLCVCVCVASFFKFVLVALLTWLVLRIRLGKSPSDCKEAKNIETSALTEIGLWRFWPRFHCCRNFNSTGHFQVVDLSTHRLALIKCLLKGFKLVRLGVCNAIYWLELVPIGWRPVSKNWGILSKSLKLKVEFYCQLKPVGVLVWNEKCDNLRLQANLRKIHRSLQ